MRLHIFTYTLNTDYTKAQAKNSCPGYTGMIVDDEKHAHINGLGNAMAPNIRQCFVSYDKKK